VVSRAISATVAAPRAFNPAAAAYDAPSAAGGNTAQIAA
jgi:hypothetical protein